MIDLQLNSELIRRTLL